MHFRRHFTLLVLAFIINSARGLFFPNIVEKCHAGNTTCIANAIAQVLHNFPDGVPQIGLPRIDPLRFEKTTITQGQDSPININLSFDDGFVKGFSHMRVKRVIGFDKDPRNSKFEMLVTVPRDVTYGKYEGSGRILLLPVNGRGNFNTTFHNLDMDLKFHTQVKVKDGEDYLVLKKIDVDMNTKKSQYYFENLFNDKELSDNINVFLNENHDILFREIRKTLAQSRATVLQKILAPIFEKYPYSSLFAEV